MRRMETRFRLYLVKRTNERTNERWGGCLSMAKSRQLNTDNLGNFWAHDWMVGQKRRSNRAAAFLRLNSPALLQKKNFINFTESWFKISRKRFCWSSFLSFLSFYFGSIRFKWYDRRRQSIERRPSIQWIDPKKMFKTDCIPTQSGRIDFLFEIYIQYIKKERSFLH